MTPFSNRCDRDGVSEIVPVYVGKVYPLGHLPKWSHHLGHVAATQIKIYPDNRQWEPCSQSLVKVQLFDRLSFTIFKVAKLFFEFCDISFWFLRKYCNGSREGEGKADRHNSQLERQVKTRILRDRVGYGLWAFNQVKYVRRAENNWRKWTQINWMKCSSTCIVANLHTYLEWGGPYASGPLALLLCGQQKCWCRVHLEIHLKSKKMNSIKLEYTMKFFSPSTTYRILEYRRVRCCTA